MAPDVARLARPPRSGGELDRRGERARRAGPAPEHQRHRRARGRARRLAGARRWSSASTPSTWSDSSASSSGLRRPGGGDSARRALGELLLAHGDEIQRAVVSMAGVYLRAGLIGEAARRTAVAGRTDRRRSRAARACSSRPPSPTPRAADYLALARRFLPRIDFLGGTATRGARSGDRAARAGGRASRAARTTPSCSCSRATSRACCRRTSWPSAGWRRPQLVLEHTPGAAELHRARLRRADRALLPAPAPAPRSRARRARLRRGRRAASSASPRRASASRAPT